jgi:tRNA modification GTPase
VEGIPVTFVDTAGIRLQTADVVESEGVHRATRAAGIAELVLVVVDRSDGITEDDLQVLGATRAFNRLLIANKCDLPAAPVGVQLEALSVSAETGQGLEGLRASVADALAGHSWRDTPAITNIRHMELLERAHAALERAGTAAAHETPEEFVLADVNEARMLLEDMTGRRTADDTLQAIFSTFCIGK